KVPQPIVGRQLELLCGVISLADDVFAVGVEPNHFEFPHGFSSQALCRSATTRHRRTLIQLTSITCADTLGGCVLMASRLKAFDDPVDTLGQGGDVMGVDLAKRQDRQL